MRLVQIESFGEEYKNITINNRSKRTVKYQAWIHLLMKKGCYGLEEEYETPIYHITRNIQCCYRINII